MKEMMQDNEARMGEWAEEAKANKAMIHNLQARMKRLTQRNQARTQNLLTKIEELKQDQQVKVGELKAYESRIAQLEANTISKERFELVEQFAAPFKLPPSKKMINIMKCFKDDGLSPVLSDQFGKYETINWNKIGGDLNWHDQWVGIKRKEKGFWLSFPPLLLPRQYGKCVIVLWIDWRNDQLVVGGMIPSAVPDLISIPESISIDAQISVKIDGQIMNRQRRIFKIIRSYSTFFVISTEMNADWNLPSVDVQVFPLTQSA